MGFKGNVDRAIPAFIVSPQTPYKVHILWEVPEFGKVILSADNEGDGYSEKNQGGEKKRVDTRQAGSSACQLTERLFKPKV